MNKELLLNVYDLLITFYNKNQQDVIEYNKMLIGKKSYEERMVFISQMQINVDKFHDLAKLYKAYKVSGSKDLENEIIKKYHEELEIDISLSSKPIDDSKKEEKAEEESIGKKPVVFPEYIPTNKGEETEKKPVFPEYESIKSESPSVETSRTPVFPKYSSSAEKHKTEEKPKKKRIFNRIFKGRKKSTFNKIKEYFKKKKMAFKERYNNFLGINESDTDTLSEELRPISDWNDIYGVEIIEPTGFITEYGNYNPDMLIVESKYSECMRNSTIKTNAMKLKFK